MRGDSVLARQLANIVGARHVLARKSELLVYESDGLPGYRKRPSLAVFPGSQEETLAVLELLSTAGVAFVPRGAGTGLSGGALADEVVLLGLNRLRRILAIDAENRLAVVEPGVVNSSLSSAAAPHGLYYAPDPSSQTACTIGGNVAENAGGPHCLKYGVTTNHVLALKVALPDATVIHLGSAGGEREGYDLCGAFVGSEGCFGVALEITVRLLPLPQAVRTLLADFASIEAAGAAVSAIVATGIVPAALEMMDGATVAAVESSIFAAGYPVDAAAVLLVELDGLEEAVEEDAEIVQKICLQHGARSLSLARDEARRAKLWQGRKKAFGAMGRLAPHLVVQDAVVPRTRLPEILAAIDRIGKHYQVRICNVFHAGDGNLHPNIPFNGRDPDERRRVHAAMRAIMETCIAAGGTITGEHGVGLDKIEYMPLLFSQDSLEAMCRTRDCFDPAHRSNPGKVLPQQSCREWLAAPALRSTH